MNFEEFDRYSQKEKTADHNQHHDPPCESSPWVLPIWVHGEILVQLRRALKGAPYRRERDDYEPSAIGRTQVAL